MAHIVYGHNNLYLASRIHPLPAIFPVLGSGVIQFPNFINLVSYQ